VPERQYRERLVLASARVCEFRGDFAAGLGQPCGGFDRRRDH
jgi:hypothetical protein